MGASKRRIELSDGTAWDGTTTAVLGEGTASIGTVGLDAGSESVGNVGLDAGEAHVGAIGGHTVVIEASITRPADTDAYTDGDAVTDSTSAPNDTEFSGMARVNAGSGVILSATLIDGTKGTRPTGFDLFLFDGAPTPNNDNAAFALSDADAVNILPGAPIVFTEADNGVDSGANNAVLVRNDLHIPFKCGASSTIIYGLLVVRGAYTPASAEVFTIRLGVSQD